MPDIILASGSPRRKELLEQIGLKFNIIKSTVDEDIDQEDPVKLVEQLALMKAKDVAEKVPKGSLVIGADTIVVCDRILGKPKDEQEAFFMLKYLSGRMHQVITGFCVVEAPGEKYKVSHETIDVYFREVSDEEIRAYVKLGYSTDRAGGYGIQDMGAIFIEKISGSYSGVLGLPIEKLCLMLKEFGVEVL
jgi:septum formation protein